MFLSRVSSRICVQILALVWYSMETQTVLFHIDVECIVVGYSGGTR